MALELIDKALVAISKSDFISGKEILLELLKDKPTDSVALYNLGMCYSELGIIFESIECLEKCVKYDSGNSNAYVALGFSYYKNDESDKAFNAFKKALEIHPENFYALKNIGSLAARRGDFVEALKYFEAADRIQPDVPEVICALASIHEDLGNQDEADFYHRKINSHNEIETLAEATIQIASDLAIASLTKDGPRLDAVAYFLEAFELFTHMDIEEIKKISFEIARKGVAGLAINDSEKVYALNSITGEYTGLNLLCMMYVGFSRFDVDSLPVPEALQDEFKMAQMMYRRRRDEY